MQIEKTFQTSLLADAAYVTFDELGYLNSCNTWSRPTVIDDLCTRAFIGSRAFDGGLSGNMPAAQRTGQVHDQLYSNNNSACHLLPVGSRRLPVHWGKQL